MTSQTLSERLTVALDTTDPAKAAGWTKATTPHVGLFKLGLEFFLANGTAGYRGGQGRPITTQADPGAAAAAIAASLP